MDTPEPSNNEALPVKVEKFLYLNDPSASKVNTLAVVPVVDIPVNVTAPVAVNEVDPIVAKLPVEVIVNDCGTARLFVVKLMPAPAINSTLSSSGFLGWLLLKDDGTIVGYMVGELKDIGDGRFVYYLSYFYIVKNDNVNHNLYRIGFQIY